MARLVLGTAFSATSSVAVQCDTDSNLRITLAAFKPHDNTQSSLIAIGTSSAVTVATGFTFSSDAVGNMEMELLNTTRPVGVPANTFWVVGNDTTALVDYRFLYEN